MIPVFVNYAHFSKKAEVMLLSFTLNFENIYQ